MSDTLIIDNYEYNLVPKFFEPMKAPATPLAEAFVGTIIELLLKTERNGNSPRKRQRRAADQAVFERQVAAVLSNLVEQIVTEDDRPILIQRSDAVLGRRSRYKPSFITKALTSVLDLMEQAELIDQVIGHRGNAFAKRGEATSLYVADLGSHMLAGLDAADFETLPPEETIILKSQRPNRWERGTRIEYRDDETTIRWREEMVGINEYLAQADIRYFGQPISAAKSHLQRQFTGGTFKECGRLYGGCWQTMPKASRKGSLSINGEEIVCLDYGQMLLRAAYSHAGAQPPEGDMYAIAPWGAAYREGFKKLIAALLFRTTPMKRKPKGTTSLLPQSNVGQLIWAIKQAHPAIAHLFGTGLGHELMQTESIILVDVLIQLRAKSIVALPIHDAVLVSQSDHESASQVMHDVFTDRLSVPCMISIE